MATAGQAIGVVIANAGRWNWDAALDLSALEETTAVNSCPADHPSDDEILGLVDDSTGVLITKEIPVSADLIGRLPASVRLLVEAGTGYNNVDMAAAKAKGITVCNVPAYSQEAVAHLVITFVLNHSCSLVEQQKLIAAGDRSNGFSAPLRTPHFELGGQTIGLIGGTGNIGSRVASVAAALGMKVLVSSRAPPTEQDPTSSVEIISSVDDLLRRSDFVSIHCPLNDSTRHLLNVEKLKLMKPTALLINTARGMPSLNDVTVLVSLSCSWCLGTSVPLSLTSASPLVRGMQGQSLTKVP